MEENEIEPVADGINYSDVIKESLVRGAAVAIGSIAATYVANLLALKISQRSKRKNNVNDAKNDTEK